MTFTAPELLEELGSTNIHVFAQSGVRGRNDHVASFHLWGPAHAYAKQVSKDQQVRWPGRRFYVVDTRPISRGDPAILWTVVDGVEVAREEA